MRVLGCDVSHWEGEIDWKTAGLWLSFCYFKCSDGASFVDPQFAANQAGCEERGMPHAPYHYFQPEIDPVKQASWFIKQAGVQYQRYIVDVEQIPTDGVSDVGASLYEFLLSVEGQIGKRCAIYTSAGFWNEHVHPKPAWAKDYELIVAHYTAEHLPLLPIGWSNWRIWQYTDSFYFPGCSSAADGNWYNGTLEECRQWFGNYRKVEPPVFQHTRLRSLFDQLHVRKTPSIFARELDHLAKGDTIEVDELDGVDVWVHHSKGWTAVERNGYRYMEVLK
jgi:lysozyme